MSLKDLQARASTRDMKAEFTPANDVPTMHEYRNKKGERIGIPARPRELSDVDFADIVTSGLHGEGGALSGFGNFLVEQGHPEDVYGANDRTTLPEGNVAEQDLYDEGTPGAGNEIDDEDDSYETLKSSGRQIAARRTIRQWESDLGVLETRFAELQTQAQRFENDGDNARAGILDRKCVSLGRKIIALRSRIRARKNYEQEMISYDDTPSGISELLDEEY